MGKGGALAHPWKRQKVLSRKKTISEVTLNNFDAII